MPAPLSILQKVKFLLNLSTSSNAGEAANAKEAADKLIIKYSITEEELDSLNPKEYYNENDKLYSSSTIENWKRTLAITISHYFDSQVVEEQMLGSQDNIVYEYHYFIYGDADQVKDTQFVFNVFVRKVEELLATRCIGRGNIYIESYTEGVVDSIKHNIETYGLNVPQSKKTVKKEETSIKQNTIIKSGEFREEPTQEKTDISGTTVVKNIIAYFTGIDDGKHLSLQDLLDSESEDVDQMLEEN